MAMFDAALVLMAPAAVPYLATGKAMPRTGNTGYSGQPTAAMFTCGDGRQVSLGVVQQEQYERLCRAVGREDLLSDTRFSTLAGRMLHAAALQAELSKEFAKRSGADWEAALSAAGAPCGLVRTVAEACAMPSLKDRRLVVELENLRLPPKGAPLALNAGYLCDADGPDLQGPPPRLGQHTREVLDALGLLGGRDQRYDRERQRSSDAIGRRPSLLQMSLSAPAGFSLPGYPSYHFLRSETPMTRPTGLAAVASKPPLPFMLGARFT